jgi:hypothetical protein
MTRCTQRWSGILLVASCFVASVCLARDKTCAAASHKEQSSEKKPGFAEFQERVQAYDKLRSDMREGIPPVHRKDTPEEIQRHQQALAQKIQGARKDAKQGEIFTDNAKEAFRGEIQEVFSGKRGQTIRRTLIQGSPVRVELFVNRPYPDTIPVTTVPPTLLQHFPKLPKLMEYRIVADRLVLEDTESRLVVDIFAGAFSNAPPY